MHWDAYGCILMRPDAFGCIRTLSENFEKFHKNPLENYVFRNFGKVLEELETIIRANNQFDSIINNNNKLDCN